MELGLASAADTEDVRAALAPNYKPKDQFIHFKLLQSTTSDLHGPLKPGQLS